MSSDPEIDLELRILLQEIAEDPKARFFKGEIPRPERITLGSIEPVSSGTARLTRAERKLVQVHREEAAGLLRLAAASVLLEDPWLNQIEFPFHGPNTRVVVPGRIEMVRILEGSAKRELEQRDSFVVRESLQDALRLLGAGSPDASRFAALSLRLAQNDSAYVHLARHLLIQGHAHAAETMLWGIARRSGRSLIGAVALSWIGVIQARAGRYPQALAVCRAAAQAGQTVPDEHFSWLGCAILAKDHAAAHEAMREIDERYEPLDAGVDDWIRARRFERERWPWPTSLESHQLAQQITSSSDSTARRIADVYA